MIPAFEIYFSILSDAWMPWLKENTGEEKFEPVVLAGEISLRDASPAFFNGLLKAFKKQPNFCPEKVLAEIEQLATIKRSQAARHLAEVFMNQPAHSVREVFYLVVTGQCLGAYYDWYSRVAEESEETLRAFYLNKTLNRLHNLLRVSEPAARLPVSHIMPAIRVKLALVVLFHKIRETAKAKETGITAFFNTEEWLEDYLQSMTLPQKTVDSLQNIFLQLVRKPSSPNIAATYEHALPHHNEIMEKQTELSPTSELAPLIHGLHQNFSNLQQVVGMLAKEKNSHASPEYIGSGEVMRLLKISKSTLQRHRRDGKVKYKQIGGKFLYSKAHIESMLNSARDKS
jgi:hypothetical protein